MSSARMKTMFGLEGASAATADGSAATTKRNETARRNFMGGRSRPFLFPAPPHRNPRLLFPLAQFLEKARNVFLEARIWRSAFVGKRANGSRKRRPLLAEIADRGERRHRSEDIVLRPVGVLNEKLARAFQVGLGAEAGQRSGSRDAHVGGRVIERFRKRVVRRGHRGTPAHLQAEHSPVTHAGVRIGARPHKRGHGVGRTIRSELRCAMDAIEWKLRFVAAHVVRGRASAAAMDLALGQQSHVANLPFMFAQGAPQSFQNRAMLGYRSEVGYFVTITL